MDSVWAQRSQCAWERGVGEGGVGRGVLEKGEGRASQAEVSRGGGAAGEEKEGPALPRPLGGRELRPG